MDYFWLRQDRRYVNPPVIEGFYTRMRRKDFVPENRYKIPDRNVVYCDSDKNLDFTDVLDRQLFLVSEKVKNVFKLYEKSIIYKCFCLLNNQRNEYMLYYAPLISEIDSFFNENELTLKGEGMGSSSIFRVKCESKEVIVVRLDVAESLLRRNPEGIELRKIRIHSPLTVNKPL
ncbi:MAG: hypothetical protein LIP16_04960 [Clostridium sp.]|nr:hypothetical protein [Clostridium sp.]